jgi:crotonobetainyl-CoA:carnitine CoA-transferase CaiB-like acyl-CoA transferase
LASDERFTSNEARKQNEDALDAILDTWTADRDRFALAEDLQRVGVPAYPSMTPKDLVEDPQLIARDYFERHEHPVVGRRVHAGIPWRLAEGPNGVRSAAPLLGADTDDVLRGVLGCDDAEIARLRGQGIVGGKPPTTSGA